MNGLSVGDGFKFGCGFFIAGFVAWFVMVIFWVLLILLMGILGLSVTELYDDFSLVLPLLAIV